MLLPLLFSLYYFACNYCTQGITENQPADVATLLNTIYHAMPILSITLPYDTGYSENENLKVHICNFLVVAIYLLIRAAHPSLDRVTVTNNTSHLFLAVSQARLFFLFGGVATPPNRNKSLTCETNLFPGRIGASGCRPAPHTSSRLPWTCFALGFGRHAYQTDEQSPHPSNDGPVLLSAFWTVYVTFEPRGARAVSAQFVASFGGKSGWHTECSPPQ